MQYTYDGYSFKIEDKLAPRLEKICDRVTRKHPTQDAWIENSGNEGEGKTNASILESAIFKLKTGRPISLFFKTSSCIEFAQSTENQIIILDEPAFQMLAIDFSSEIAKDFLRLSSTVRKKRHILIVNFAKFWKFPEFLVVDRCLFMLHLHSRNGKDPGRFLFIGKKKLEQLWNGYKKNGKRLYGKLKSFGGRLPYVMEDLFDKLDIRIEDKMHATLKDYDKMKDMAIASIAKKENKKEIEAEKKLEELRYKIATLSGIEKGILARHLDVDPKRLREWAKLAPIQSVSLENVGFQSPAAALLITRVADQEKILPAP